MHKPIDVFTMPRATPGHAFYTLAPSMVMAYPERATTREVPYNNLLFLLLRRPWRSERRVLCIHWSTILYGSKYTLKSLLLLCANTVSLMILKKVYGFEVAWVLHNNFAHDYPHPWIDAVGRKFLFWVSDVFVAQQKVTQQESARMYPKQRTVYIPHSNYVDAYGPLRDRDAMRAKFGFTKDDIVLLSYGTIKPYKKIEYFIDALHELGDSLDPRIKLWVVGKSDGDYLAFLRERAQGSPRIRLEGASVPGEDTPMYTACADYGVFYFDESELTSASVLSMLSYGLPVITRAIAGTEEIHEGKNGLLFQTMPELLSILRTLPEQHMTPPAEVIKSLEGSDFKSVELRYIELYESMTQGPNML